MKPIITFLAALFGLLASSAAALAQTAEQHVENAAAKAQSAVASTGVPLWVWVVVAVVVLLAIIALARRRRASQAVIKTRLG